MENFEIVLNEDEIFEGNFFFVSYSHQDGDVVREDVNALINRGVRLWIDHRNENDENMSLGDDWQDKVKRAVLHPNCRGVIFYNSGAARASEAIWLEEKYTEQRKQEDPDFKHFVINIDGKTQAEIINLTFSKLVEKGIAHKYGEASIRQQTLFGVKEESVLYHLREDSEACVEALYAKAVELGVADDKLVMVKTLEKTGLASKDSGEVCFGCYKGEFVAKVAAQPNGRSNGAIYQDSKAYKERKLFWRVLYVKDGRTVMLCSEQVEQCPATNAKDALKAFAEIAFNEQERAAVKAVRLLNASDEENTEDGAVFDFGDEPVSWWIDEPGLIQEWWQKVYKNGGRYGHGFLKSLMKGLRPVIEVSSADLEKMKKEK